MPSPLEPRFPRAACVEGRVGSWWLFQPLSFTCEVMVRALGLG